MKILYIGYEKSKIKDFLESTENLFYIDGSEKITLENSDNSLDEPC